MNFSLRFLAPLTAVVLLGAGCGSSAPKTTSADPYQDTGKMFAAGNGQASKVPSDIPVYPGGFVIAVSGEGAQVSVAQSTPDTATKVTDWIKGEYARRGATIKSTSQEGMSTNILFETTEYTYTVRVDRPADNGAAFLTISRGGK
jgi:hypothetical protein